MLLTLYLQCLVHSEEAAGRAKLSYETDLEAAGMSCFCVRCAVHGLRLCWQLAAGSASGTCSRTRLCTWYMQSIEAQSLYFTPIVTERNVASYAASQPRKGSSRLLPQVLQSAAGPRSESERT